MQTEIKNNVIKNLYNVKSEVALTQFEHLKRGFIFLIYTLLTVLCFVVFFQNQNQSQANAAVEKVLSSIKLGNPPTIAEGLPFGVIHDFNDVASYQKGLDK